MKIETEIKLAIENSEVDGITKKIESLFKCKRSQPFHQKTHQFFYEDWTKQNAFPRVRNEEDGSITLTVKAKIKEDSDFFKRIEIETTIGSDEKLISMMSYFGYPKKITWEKRRHSFTGDNNNVCFYIDETPIGWFLEIESEENKIENAIKLLGLKNAKRINKSYLGLWEDYKIEYNISENDMIFTTKD